MNTIKSIQFYATIVLFMFLLCSEGCILGTLILAAIFAANAYVAYKIWTSSDEKDIRIYTGADWFQKKTGIDLFSEED